MTDRETGPAIRRVNAVSLCPPPTYAHASVVPPNAALAFLGGAVPLDPDGRVVGVDDPVVQTRQVLSNLEAQLAAVGSTIELVVMTTVHVVSSEPAVLASVWEVVEASGLAVGPHSSTLVGVACLGYPDQLVEITAVAAIPQHQASVGVP